MYQVYVSGAIVPAEPERRVATGIEAVKF